MTAETFATEKISGAIDEHDAQRMQFTDSTAMCGAASVIDDTVSHASCGDERLGCKRVVD
jgi:hypothetical protein